MKTTQCISLTLIQIKVHLVQCLRRIVPQNLIAVLEEQVTILNSVIANIPLVDRIVLRCPRTSSHLLIIVVVVVRDSVVATSEVGFSSYGNTRNALSRRPRAKSGHVYIWVISWLFSSAGSNKSSHEEKLAIMLTPQMNFNIFCFIIPFYFLEVYFSTDVIETRLRCFAYTHFHQLTLLGKCQQAVATYIY